MIEHYEIRKVNKEKVLILYLSYDYEFSSDYKDNTLLDRINNFIRVSKMKWKGNKIILVVGGVVLGSLILGTINTPNRRNNKFDYVSTVILNHYDEDNNELGYSKIEIDEPIIITEEKEEVENVKNNIKDEQKEEIIISEENNNIPKEEVPTPPPINNENVNEEINTYVTVYRTNGSVETIELEEYVTRVVASEMPAEFNIEALKAQSIAARTYALKSIKEGKILTDNEKTQSYKDLNQLRIMWGTDFDKYYNKVKSAVEETKGLAIFYNNDYIEALYHSTSNGYTESSYEVFGHTYPYLTNVVSSWDINASSFLRQKEFSFEELKNILGIDFNTDTLIEIIERNESGRISRIRINDNYYTGIELRNLLGLRSADFDINVDIDKVIITTRGYGHGVGMSQYGANGMANSGKSYIEILKHYYPGTIVKTV